MKKTFFLAAVMCLLAVSAWAQDKKATDFSGKWTLDVAKSKLDERMRVESMTMTVAQTDKDIKVETATKRLPPPADAPQGGMGGNGGGMMRGGMGGMGGDAARTYTLDGKEVVTTQDSPRGASTVKQKSKIEGGKLMLSTARTFNGPNGEMTMTTKETWELTDGGKGLKVKRESESPRGPQTTEMYFTKN